MVSVKPKYNPYLQDAQTLRSTTLGTIGCVVGVQCPQFEANPRITFAAVVHMKGQIRGARRLAQTNKQHPKITPVIAFSSPLLTHHFVSRNINSLDSSLKGLLPFTSLRRHWTRNANDVASSVWHGAYGARQRVFVDGEALRFVFGLNDANVGSDDEGIAQPETGSRILDCFNSSEIFIPPTTRRFREEHPSTCHNSEIQRSLLMRRAAAPEYSDFASSSKLTSVVLKCTLTHPAPK